MRANPLILIVDDEKDFLEIMTAKFEAVGFETAIAHDGKEAVAKAIELIPDLVLMDIHMPGETGTDVALAIKQEERTANVKIAFLTALKEPWPAVSGDRKKITEELGMEDFIEKTEDLDVIVQKVQEILSRGYTETASAPQETVQPLPPEQSQEPQISQQPPRSPQPQELQQPQEPQQQQVPEEPPQAQ